MSQKKYPKGAEALLIALQTPNNKGTIGIPVLIWGKPGEGKSSFLDSLSTSDFPVLTLIASIHDPTDFSGLPIIKNDKVHYAVPEWVEKFDTKEGGILFLDELTTAPPAVQAALLRVVLERKVGFHDLPKYVRIVSAANPPDLMTGGWELSPPLRNRFVHLQWELTTEVYKAALLNGFEKARLPEIPIDEHKGKEQEYKLLINSFLSRTPNLLSSSPENDRYGFASPRSWDNAAALMASCAVLGLSPLQTGQETSSVFLELLAGCVGDGVATNFIGYIKNLRLPDPKAVLDGIVEVDLEQLNESEIFILFNGFKRFLSKETEETALIERSKILIPLIENIVSMGNKDIIFPAMRHLAKEEHYIARLIRRTAQKDPQMNKTVMQFLESFFSSEGFEDYVKLIG